MEILILILFLLFMLIVLWWAYTYSEHRKHKISSECRKKIQSHLEHIEYSPLPQQIIEYDKVLDMLLKEKGYQGTLGEKMKQYGRFFKNENAIWSAHKTRNTIVHEVGASFPEKELLKYKRAFKDEISLLLK